MEDGNFVRDAIFLPATIGLDWKTPVSPTTGDMETIYQSYLLHKNQYVNSCLIESAGPVSEIFRS